ncbi:MAG: sugar phosphate isomerase/epimerase [Thermoproteales archaeon]|nr:sugar phosphate isomerase/epimerase [Thermoproteales archaeon]
MKKGLNLWTVFGFSYSGKPSIEEILEKAKEFGYDGIEFVFDDALLDLAKISKDDRKRYVEKVESLGLQIPSVASGVFWKYNLGSTDEKLREKGRQYVKGGIDLAVDLGARVVLVVPAVADPNIPYEKIYSLSVEEFKELSRYAEDRGIIIGLENVWNKFLYSPLEFRRYLDEINSEYVAAYFDIGNIVALGYHEHWIKLLKGKIAMVHVKDFDVNVGNINGFRHIGKGSIDWKKVISLLKEAGYDDFLNVECPPEFYPDLKTPKYPEDGYRAAKENVEALRKILE